MYHFVQYLYHFIFNLLMTLVVPCLHNMFMVLLIFALGNFNIGSTKPIFLDSVSPTGEGGRVCVGMVCYHFIAIVHPLNSSTTLFSLSLTTICAALWCQTSWGHIPLLCAKLEPQRRHLRSKTMVKVCQNLGFECIHLIGQNKHSKFTYNTLRILPIKMTCAEVCSQNKIKMKWYK